jgi:hypothetical protein
MGAVVLTDTAANAALDGVTATVTGGDVQFWTAGRVTLLATLVLPTPAFAAAAARSAAINAITAVLAGNAGTVAEAVFRTSGGAERFSGSVTTTGGNGLVEFDVVVWGAGDSIDITGGSLSYPA